jgi:hypothetical protein
MDLSVMMSTSPWPPTAVKILTGITLPPTYEDSIKIASPNDSVLILSALDILYVV